MRNYKMHATGITVTCHGGHIADALGVDNMDTDITSTVVELGELYSECSIQVTIDNTDAVGVLYIQESNYGGKWTNCVFDDGSSSITIASAVDLEETYHINSYSRFLRVFYDRTSGNGQCDVYAQLKEKVR